MTATASWATPKITVLQRETIQSKPRTCPMVKNDGTDQVDIKLKQATCGLIAGEVSSHCELAISNKATTPANAW
jgi:hypothetical protein